MPLADRIGQMIMVRYPDTDILEKMLAAGHAGSFYFGMKGKPAQEVAETLNRLQGMAKYPQLVAFGSACTTCGAGLLQGGHMRIGATRSPDIAYRLANIETREQRAYGFHVVDAPVLDVNTNPLNPIINTRALGDDAGLVTRLGVQMLRGIIDGRGCTCTMHFPGHGATADDSHIRVPVDARGLEKLRSVDLLPYLEAIPQGLINGLCTNHVHYSALEAGQPAPSTVSRRVVTELLRHELGYDGVVLSDSLTMKPMKDAYGIEESAILTVLAGHDIILQDYQSDPRITHAALVRAVRDGRIPAAQVDASVRRVMRLKQWLGLFNNRFADVEKLPEQVATQESRQFALQVARAAVTVLENDVIPLQVSDPSKCLVITNGSAEAWDADMGLTFLPSFEKLYRAFESRLPGVQTFTLGEGMSPAELSEAQQRASKAHVVVFGLFTRVLCYHEDSIGLPVQYAELIRQVTGMGKPVVLINCGNPYVMRHLPRADASLCTYDAECPESMQAAVEVLFGDIRSKGKLPVRVSTEYPFGHGL